MVYTPPYNMISFFIAFAIIWFGRFKREKVDVEDNAN